MAGTDVTLTMRDMERLIDWMRRSGRPQTVQALARRYVELLREERGIKNK
ncbi:MAG: hypothetical protein IVW55_04255 [Chloroflexi bacterium]|nr:hypothetical protein [Chloroflexota bacterium]